MSVHPSDENLCVGLLLLLVPKGTWHEPGTYQRVDKHSLLADDRQEAERRGGPCPRRASGRSVGSSQVSTCGWMQARDGQEAAPDGRPTLLLSGYVLCVSLFFSYFVTDICCSVLLWRQNVKQKILGGYTVSPHLGRSVWTCHVFGSGLPPPLHPGDPFSFPTFTTLVISSPKVKLTQSLQLMCISEPWGDLRGPHCR